MRPEAKVSQVRERYTQAIFDKPNVVGVGTGYKVTQGKQTSELCVIALVRQKVPKAGLQPDALVPDRLEDIGTDVIEIGVPRALQARTDRWRPAPGGVSLGHFQITAGTFGSIVRDRGDGSRLILSNSHVLAESGDADLGDPILQPGTADGGREAADTIGTLERFCPIQFTSGPATCGLAKAFADLGNQIAKLLGSKHRVRAYRFDPQATNLVDAAVARPIEDGMVLDEILDIGVIGGTAGAQLGMPVRKSGRTTSFTNGNITVMETTIDVQYGERTARFENQIVTNAMSQPGDSGSLLVAADSLLAVGLLFAGSDQATIHNPIQAVLDCLEVVL